MKKEKYILIFSFLTFLNSICIYAQDRKLNNCANFNYDKGGQVQSVSFTGITIQKDDRTGRVSVPQWKNTNVSNPIAYYSGSNARARARFSYFKCKEDPYAKGEFTYNGMTIEFPEKVLVVDSNGNYLYEDQDADKPFTANLVNYIPNFEVKWFVKEGLNGTWKPAGSSINPLYITYAYPLDDSRVYYSVLHIGCNGAKGKTVKDDVVDGCFNDFTNKDVKLVNGTKKAQYWGPLASNQAHQAAFTKAENILDFQDGRCGTWAEFFQLVLATQGISSTKTQIRWKDHIKVGAINLLTDANKTVFENSFKATFPNETLPLQSNPDGFGAFFFIPKWCFNDNELFYQSDKNKGGFTFSGKQFGECDLLGEAGQGNEDPASSFIDHTIVKYSTKFYDPSYGKKSDNENDWENQSVIWFGTEFRVEGKDASGMSQVRTLIWLKEKNIINIQQTKFD